MNWIKDNTQKEILISNLIEFGIGASAKSILLKSTGKDKGYYLTYPVDHTDLMRCINVIDIFGIDIKIMSGVGKEWDKIINKWDELTNLCKIKNYNAVNSMFDSFKDDSTISNEPPTRLFYSD